MIRSIKDITMFGTAMVVILAAAGPAWAIGATTPEAFFTPAEDRGANLPDDQLYPQGRLFPVSFFSVGGDSRGHGGEPQTEEQRQKMFQRYVNDDFTALGPQYELNDRVLADAAALGLKAIYTIGGGPKDGSRWSKNDLRDVGSDEIVASIRSRVEAVLADENEEHLGWWYLAPEELRSWRAHEIEYLKLAVNTIHEMDPRGRPVWMYDPGHRGASGLVPTATHLDIVGKGMYTNYAGQVHDRVWCRWTIDVQNQAIEKANPKAVSIAVPEAFRHPGRYVEALAKDEQAALPVIRQWVRHDVYAALIEGAQGMVVFSLRERPVDPKSNDLPFEGEIYEAYYRAYAEIAGELTGELGLGDVLLFGEQRDDVQIETLQGPSTLTLTYRDNDPVNYPSIGHRSMAYGQDRYLFLVNSANEAVSAMVSDLPYGDDIEVCELFTDHTFSLGEGEFKVNMQPYEVRVYRLRWLRP